MTTSTHLVRSRRFLPLFATQLLGAFNDNLFKNAMVLFVVYSVYNSEAAEAQFSAIATALVVIPFVALSALSGQLADLRDKSAIIRIVKFCEILIMLVGGAGLLLAWPLGQASLKIEYPPEPVPPSRNRAGGLPASFEAFATLDRATRAPRGSPSTLVRPKP